MYSGHPLCGPASRQAQIQASGPSATLAGREAVRQSGPIAPQKHNPQGFMPELVQSEDCLNLNVWTPGAGDKLKPVMVYIHGGDSYRAMERSATDFAMPEDEIVYVSINYRLGALGFLYLVDLLGKEYATSGNNGMLDIAAALQWVQLNITAFGGDPSRVTVIGNSAGPNARPHFT